jgi:hypothetical protein
VLRFGHDIGGVAQWGSFPATAGLVGRTAGMVKRPAWWPGGSPASSGGSRWYSRVLASPGRPGTGALPQPERATWRVPRSQHQVGVPANQQSG